jgi:hypothetical protein
MRAREEPARLAPRRPLRRTGLLLALVLGPVIAVVTVLLVTLFTSSPSQGIGGLPVDALPRGVLFRDTFDGPDGLITNHYAMWSGDPAAVRSPDWEVESGSMLRRDGAAWTGVPTAGLPNLDSSTGSGSEIFRAWTTRSDFGDVRVDLRLRNLGYVHGSPGWPAKSWDGIKIWLRRQAGSGRSVALYTAEVNRRQGNIIVQKRCWGARRYVLLAASRADRPAHFGRWEHVGGLVHTDVDGSVTIAVIRSGHVALRATDTGAGGCRPITAPGKVGIRGDNAQFLFDDFTVTNLDR